MGYQSKLTAAGLAVSLLLMTMPVWAETKTAAAATNVKATETVVASKAADAYFLTQGKTYEKVKALLEGLPTASTGLNKAERPYGVRIDKLLTGDYFYHAQAYDDSDRKVFGDYLIAKDESCAWKVENGKESKLIYGNTEKLLKKAKLYLLARHITKGDVGQVRVLLPGPIPYDLRLTSLNQTVATIDKNQNILPVSYGKVDILADLQVGGSIRSEKLRAYIVDRQQWEDESSSTSRPSIGIGIGIGGWHHHHGGVDIGIGGVIWDA